jgi:hypothetical protein
MKRQHKFHQITETRWLARYNVINIKLEQWEELFNPLATPNVYTGC